MSEDLSQLTDVGVFAERLLGVALFPHQLEAAQSPARYRCLLSGRQAGKSRLLAVLALHEAATRRNRNVMLVSAGEVASQRLLEDCAALATSSPLLRGSVMDESKAQLTLSNGSVIRSVPASQRQIRGASIDLLILDEAGFLDPEIWRAAEPTVIARPGSRVILASSPWGGADHFFRQLWRRGMDAPDEHVAAWHWPSSISPLVSAELLEQIREREPAHYFAREYLAEFQDDVASFFTTQELERATGDFEMVPPEQGAALGLVAGGVDWASRRDAQALSVIAGTGWDDRGRPMYRLVWCEEHFSMSYDAWIERLVEVAGGFRFSVIASETNGVGDYPTVMLAKRLWETGRGRVEPVQTTAKLKESAFSLMRILFEQGRLQLPRHPTLLRQLAALEAEQLDGGGLRISVPERAGHDDLAMSAAQAVLQLGGAELVPEDTRIYELEDIDPEFAAEIESGYLRRLGAY